MGCCVSKVDDSLAGLYKLKAEVGTGAEATVWLGQSVTSKSRRALKMISTTVRSNRLDTHRNLMNEAQSLAWLWPGHVNVVPLREVILTHKHVILVLDWVNGGSLSSYCRSRPHLTEHEALYFFKQMVAAVDFCHRHHVAHRDLKLENILVDTTCLPPRICLADFGLSKHWEPSNKLCRMHTIAGTPGYISPEVVGSMFGGPQHSYDGMKADVWALGVMLVTLLLHHKPYAYSELRDLSVRALLRSMYHQQLHTRWVDSPNIRDAAPGLSADLRDLLGRIFVSDAAERISLEGIKAHPWFLRRLPSAFQAQLDVMDAEQARRERCAQEACSEGQLEGAELRQQLLQLQKELEAGGVSSKVVRRVAFAQVPSSSSDSTEGASRRDVVAVPDQAVRAGMNGSGRRVRHDTKRHKLAA